MLFSWGVIASLFFGIGAIVKGLKWLWAPVPQSEKSGFEGDNEGSAS
jgi:hypothetical protein